MTLRESKGNSLGRIYRNGWLTLFCQHILASDVQTARPTDEVRCDWISTLDHQRHLGRLGRFSWTETCCGCCWDQDMFVLIICWFPVLNINCNNVNFHVQIQNCSVQPGSAKEQLLLRPRDSISACDACIYYTRSGKHIHSAPISYMTFILSYINNDGIRWFVFILCF